MADISKVSIDGGTTEYNLKDSTARSDITAINGKIGAANGIASLNGTGKVPESQLPSYVDDVIEGYLYNGAFYEDSAHTKLITAETGKIYIDLATNNTYRWGGSVYVLTGSNLDEESVEGIIKSTVGFSIVNILDVDAESGSTEINGVTFEVNRYFDGSLQNITVNGTATSNASFMVASKVADNDYNELSGNTYILNGCPEGGSLFSSFCLSLEGDYGGEAQDTGEGVLITNPIVNGKLYIRVASGTTLNNAVFYPMIRNKAIKDSTYKRHLNDNVKKQLSKKQDNMTYSYSNGRLTLNTIAEAE